MPGVRFGDSAAKKQATSPRSREAYIVLIPLEMSDSVGSHWQGFNSLLLYCLSI